MLKFLKDTPSDYTYSYITKVVLKKSLFLLTWQTTEHFIEQENFYKLSNLRKNKTFRKSIFEITREPIMFCTELKYSMTYITRKWKDCLSSTASGTHYLTQLIW